MLNLDIDKIINGTPEKKLLNMYESLKNDYTKENAKAYQEAYINESFDFLIDNSEKIFAEAYYGLDYYTSVLTRVGNLCPSIVRSEREKIDSYLESYGDKMEDGQRVLYKNLSESLTTIIENCKNFEVVTSYLSKVTDVTESVICNAVMKEDKETLMNIFNESPKTVLISYGPKVLNLVDLELNDVFESVVNDYTSEKDFKQYREFASLVAVGNKLQCDAPYRESVSALSRSIRKVCNYFETASLNDLYRGFSEVLTESTDILYSSPSYAINSLYNDVAESALYAEEDEAEKTINESIQYCIEMASLELLLEEFKLTDNTNDICTGYSLFDENVTIENAVASLSERVSKYDIFEEAPSDLPDEEIEKILNDDNGYTGKKPQAPTLTRRQAKTYSAMDKEAQYFQNKSKRNQVGVEKRNLLKAATAIPRDFVNSIQDQIRAIDNADLKRREKYMLEPGFRKKGVRNLKLALMYGTVAQVKLSLIPVTMVCRHFSKTRDLRVRNELVRELQMNLKLTEEKINDANAEGDKAAKYQLMRIKAQLEKELVRVQTNSKYV